MQLTEDEIEIWQLPHKFWRACFGIWGEESVRQGNLKCPREVPGMFLYTYCIIFLNEYLQNDYYAPI